VVIKSGHQVRTGCLSGVFVKMLAPGALVCKSLAGPANRLGSGKVVEKTSALLKPLLIFYPAQ
jgi:hypothetical protein